MRWVFDKVMQHANFARSQQAIYIEHQAFYNCFVVVVSLFPANGHGDTSFISNHPCIDVLLLELHRDAPGWSLGVTTAMS
jgi:hypothetical protein